MLGPNVAYLCTIFDNSSFSRSRDMAGAHQNVNSSRDLTTPLSGTDREVFCSDALFTDKNFSPPATVVYVYYGALSDGYAVDIGNVGRRRNLLITPKAHFSVAFIWHGESHARCAIIESIAATRVQNYTGSRIKRGSSGKCFSGWLAIFALFVYDISSDTERRAGVLPIAESLVKFYVSVWF